MRAVTWLAVVGSIALPIECHNYKVNSKGPNIIFFLVDDMGWNDVGYHNMTQIPTPNIDTLASNGIILNNYYTHPACSPSRSALLSGFLATTTGLQHEVILDSQRVGLPLQLKTMPEMLRRQGYATEMIGKWHLGFYKKQFTPTYRGFDHFYGFWTGDTDHFYHLTTSAKKRSDLYGIPCYATDGDDVPLEGLSSRENLRPVQNAGRYLAYEYTDRAKQVIRRHNTKKPLFLYLSHHGVHRGNPTLRVRAPKSLVDLFSNIQDQSRSNFAGALTAIDRSLGEVMVALEKKNMLEDTIIVFSSDNGSPLPGDLFNGGSNYPLRGGKVTGWEGGVRTNSFVWYNKLKYSGIYDGLMHIVDWMPTLYKAAGGRQDISAKYSLDGKDMWDSIQKNSSSPRTNIVLQNDSMIGYTVYRSGDFKLVIGQLPQDGANTYYGDSGREPPPADYPKRVSKAEEVLRRFYRKVGKQFKAMGPVIQVKCLDQSQNIACDYSLDAPCLYNLKDDPCEQINLAPGDPETVARLLEELRQIRGAPPNFPKGDYGSNPIYYGGYWSSWVDEKYDYNSTSC